MSFETDTESKNGLDPGSTETVSRYSTTLQMYDIFFFPQNSYISYRGSTATIDADGYAYYAERRYCCPRDNKRLIWFWDNNQYDLLVELTTRAIEILELRYGDATYNFTRVAIQWD